MTLQKSPDFLSFSLSAKEALEERYGHGYWFVLGFLVRTWHACCCCGCCWHLALPAAPKHMPCQVSPSRASQLRAIFFGMPQYQKPRRLILRMESPSRIVSRELTSPSFDSTWAEQTGHNSTGCRGRLLRVDSPRSHSLHVCIYYTINTGGLPVSISIHHHPPRFLSTPPFQLRHGVWLMRPGESENTGHWRTHQASPSGTRPSPGPHQAPQDATSRLCTAFRHRMTSVSCSGLVLTSNQSNEQA